MVDACCRSRSALRTRSHRRTPKAAETVGIESSAGSGDVILGRIFARLAGAWSALDFGTSFQAGMTKAHGFVALAALIFGRSLPISTFGGAPVRRRRLAQHHHPHGPSRTDSSNMLTAIPDQFWSALPYLVTIIILASASAQHGSGRRRQALERERLLTPGPSHQAQQTQPDLTSIRTPHVRSA